MVGSTLIGLLVGLAPAVSEASSCTDGVDCYCDKVTNPSDPQYDPKLLVCEDFEAVTLHDDVNLGAGAPTYGPWYDDTGAPRPGDRGFNSYWVRHYGSGENPCRWRGTMPTPTRGEVCPFAKCNSATEWSAGDPWTANDIACLDILRNGEFDDEVSTITAPSLPSGGSGVFDGRQVLGHRVGKGFAAGITGDAGFRAVTEIGVTMAFGYASNVLASGVWNYPWKHNQFSGNTPSNWESIHPGKSWYLPEHWSLGRTGAGSSAENPYRGFRIHTGWPNGDKTACNAALADATVSVGVARCDTASLEMGADASLYNQVADFPWGTWGCHRAHMSGIGTSNTAIRVWHNEVLVFEMTGFDGAALYYQSYDNLSWNAYSNSNQGSAGTGETPTTQTTYRYEDNVHLREGVPVSCAAINFAVGSPGAPLPPLLLP
jgi:hypothetical protein